MVLVNYVCASNLLMVGPLGTLMYPDYRFIETEITSL